MGEDPNAPFEIAQDELLDHREAIAARDHDLYVEQDNWSVVDVEAVDRLFVVSYAGEEGYFPSPFGPEPAIRVDLDGVGRGGSDVVAHGENVQVSTWLTLQMARKLHQELDEALAEWEREEGDAVE